MDEAIRRREAHWSGMLGRAERLLNIVKKKNDLKAVGFNVQMTARNALLFGMLKARISRDYEEAIKSFSIGATFSSELIDIVEKNEKTEASFFEAPIYCCILSGNFSMALALSSSLKDVPISANISWFEISARLLGAFVSDDKDDFYNLLAIYNTVEKNYRQEVLRTYIDLYGAVITRDQEKFTLLLQDVSSKFNLRAKDNNFGDELAEYGGLEENEFVLDFMALGIAAIADLRGLRSDVDTKFFPRNLFLLIVNMLNSNAVL